MIQKTFISDTNFATVFKKWYHLGKEIDRWEVIFGTEGSFFPLYRAVGGYGSHPDESLKIATKLSEDEAVFK